MAKLRSFVCYRSKKRPYTRFSKYKKLSYVRSRPHCRISRYTGGEQAESYDCKIHLVSKEDLQIRDNALESARQTMVRSIEKTIGSEELPIVRSGSPKYLPRLAALVPSLEDKAIRVDL